MAGSQILRDLGANWLECQDNLGIFYYNQVTQQSSDTVPPELAVAAAPAPQGDTAVLRELANNWLECQDAQGLFYFNQITQQSSEVPPPEAGIAPSPGVVAAPVVAAGESTILRELPGDWLECMDAQGVFFFNKITQQSSDTLPAELMGAAAPMPAAVGPMAVQTMAAPTITSMVAGGRPPVAAKVLGGGIAALEGQAIPQTYMANTGFVQVGGPVSYAPIPVGTASYTPLAAPASYTPLAAPAPASYTPGVVQLPAAPQSYTAPPGVVQLGVAPQSYTPLQVQQPVFQQAEPQVVYQTPPNAVAEPQVVYQTPQPSVTITTAPVGATAQPKSAFGDWAVYGDGAGEFFVKVSTGQRFEQPPPELVESYKAHKAAGLILAA